MVGFAPINAYLAPPEHTSKLEFQCSKQKSSQLYLDVERWKQEELNAMTIDVSLWIERLLNMPIGSIGQRLFNFLENGQALCDITSIITPESPVHAKHKNPANGTFFCRDNIALFLQWVSKMHFCITFESDDLVEHKNPANVVKTLLSMAKYAYITHQIEPPALIKAETEADQAVDDDDICSDIYDQHIDLKTHISDTNTLYSTLNNSSVNHQNINHKQTLPPVAKLRSKTPCRARPPQKDALHQAVIDVLKNNIEIQDIPIWRREQGVYVIGGAKKVVRMCLVNSLVLVRVGGGWESLKRFLSTYRYNLETSKESKIRPAELVKVQVNKNTLSIKQQTTPKTISKASQLKSILMRRVNEGPRRCSLLPPVKQKSQIEEKDHVLKPNSKPKSKPKPKPSPKSEMRRTLMERTYQNRTAANTKAHTEIKKPKPKPKFRPSSMFKATTTVSRAHNDKENISKPRSGISTQVKPTWI